MPALAGIVSALSRSAVTRSRVSSEAGLPSGVTLTIVRSPDGPSTGGETAATPGNSPRPSAISFGELLLVGRCDAGRVHDDRELAVEAGPERVGEHVVGAPLGGRGRARAAVRQPELHVQRRQRDDASAASRPTTSTATGGA